MSISLLEFWLSISPLSHGALSFEFSQTGAKIRAPTIQIRFPCIYNFGSDIRKMQNLCVSDNLQFIQMFCLEISVTNSVSAINA